MRCAGRTCFRVLFKVRLPDLTLLCTAEGRIARILIIHKMEGRVANSDVFQMFPLKIFSVT